MSTLVIADHDNAELKESTLNAVTAAKEFGADIHVLIAGSGCASVADAAAKIDGVSKVLCADSNDYQHPLAEVIALLIVDLSSGYDQILVRSINGREKTDHCAYNRICRCGYNIRFRSY